jgi:hypothetical protein
MTNLLTIIPVAAGAYIATNLDNFVLLVLLLAGTVPAGTVPVFT